MHSDPLFAAHDSSVYQISLVICRKNKGDYVTVESNEI